MGNQACLRDLPVYTLSKGKILRPFPLWVFLFSEDFLYYTLLCIGTPLKV